MSLTLGQQPNLIHQSIYPEWYRIESDSFLDSNFKYKFELNTVDGVLATSIVYPRSIGGYGYYDSTRYIKNFFGTDFQPDIATFTPCDNSILNYRIDVEEVNGDGDDLDFTKRIAIKNTILDYDYTDYILTTTTGKLLSDFVETVRKVDTTTDTGTFRFLAGKFSSTEISYAYQILCKRTRGAITTYYKSNLSNPYYTATTYTGVDTNNSTLQDLSHWLLEFPAAPKTLNSLEWIQIGTETGGVYTPGVIAIPQSNILVDGDTYTLSTYSNTRRSKELKFKVEDCPLNVNDRIQVFWESYNGGFDFHQFSKVHSKTLGIKRSLYNKQRDSITNTTIGHTDTDRGSTQYITEITEKYILNSDWIPNYEFEEMESLFSSKEVFIRIGSTYYPVILLVESVEVSTNRKGLRNITLEVELSNKKYN